MAQPEERQRRVEQVRKIPGFVALWDFVTLKQGLFDAVQPSGATTDYRLEPLNYVQRFWGRGQAATMEDFPLLGRGPFGQAIQIRKEADEDFRPLLMVPRERLHNTRIDVKGPGKSVTLIAWVIRESGNHAWAGIWHEGTDLRERSGGDVQVVQPGMRQYALFAGLAANPGGVGSHVSENGAKSFGDRYARNLSITPEKTLERAVPEDPWDVVALVFDNAKDTVTSYLNGVATDFWIETGLEEHPFFRWPAQAWKAAEAKDPTFPRDQYYFPPEGKAKRRTLIDQSANGRTELHEFGFTKVHVFHDAAGKVVKRELAALRVNPFWFPHDLFSPPSQDLGGPFTIGRVIHSSRSQGTTGWIGGVAVFDRALSPQQMKRLSAVGRTSITVSARPGS
jgi:hypothetical protein